jgi:hypothetical protein
MCPFILCTHLEGLPHRRAAPIMPVNGTRFPSLDRESRNLARGCRNLLPIGNPAIWSDRRFRDNGSWVRHARMTWTFQNFEPHLDLLLANECG